MNLNKVFVLGNLTRDPESRALPSGQTVVNFGVATNRIWNDRNGARQEDTQFHNIVAFGKIADTCAKYLSKGKMVLVEGRIQTRSWDAPDGTKKYRTEIVAEGVQLGPRFSGAGGSGEAAMASAPASGTPPKQEKPAKKEVKEEDIPVIEQESEEVDVSDLPF